MWGMIKGYRLDFSLVCNTRGTDLSLLATDSSTYLDKWSKQHNVFKLMLQAAQRVWLFFVTIVLENSMDTGFADIIMVFGQPMGFVLGGVSVHGNWLAKAHLSVRKQQEVTYYRIHCNWLSPGIMIQMILWGKSPNGHSKVCIKKKEKK